jgi:uncharacterized protein (DUF302 family)
MKRTIQVSHLTLDINADFDRFTQKLEQMLGRFNPALFDRLESDRRAVEQGLKEAAGEEGMMLFGIQEHGKLLNIFGAPRKARQYVIGNPLIAASMTRHDIRAGLYAPLRVFVYEAEGGATRVEFDQPSSLFGQFDNPEVTKVAESLDRKLANLMSKAEQAAMGEQQS